MSSILPNVVDIHRGYFDWLFPYLDENPLRCFLATWRRIRGYYDTLAESKYEITPQELVKMTGIASEYEVIECMEKLEETGVVKQVGQIGSLAWKITDFLKDEYVERAQCQA